ncbi:MAG: WG repeat-containing protein [Bacteroidetes bacterium]|nr:WG repeat-containing protein [Bacteroidota bacterium]
MKYAIFPRPCRRTEKDKWGYINTSGEYVISAQYEVTKDEHSGYVRKDKFSEGLAGVRINGKWGFINKFGKQVINPIYEDITEFKDGKAGICLNGKWGFINKNGDIIIQPIFDGIWSRINESGFFENISVVWEKDKKGFVDSKNRLITPIKYDDVYNFNRGFALVQEYRQQPLEIVEFYIDKEGREYRAK